MFQYFPFLRNFQLEQMVQILPSQNAMLFFSLPPLLRLYPLKSYLLQSHRACLVHITQD